MFIRLTNYYPSNSNPLLNINTIVSICTEKVSGKTFITTSHDGGEWAVRETPEQIQELIDEQLLKMAKLSKSA